jgi:hypothetical protein
LHTVLDVIQVVFAINEEYFTGDKKLEAVLSKLPYCPAELLENIEFLLSASHSTENLQQQCDLLCRIINDIERKINQSI